jgi:hypothetical protein
VNSDHGNRARENHHGVDSIDNGPVENPADAFVHVELALYDHFHDPDVEGARAFYAALAAHGLRGAPVWTMLVAPPGCGKTELINPLLGLPDVHLIDSITPNTLISGRAPEPNKPRGKDGLLERIGNNGMIFIPDFSTVLDGNRDKRGEIFSQLRRVYDGRLRKEFGIEGLNTEWSGRLTVGVAVTPEVDRHTAVFGSLGERFLIIRWKRAGGIDAAITAMRQDTQAKDAAMRAAVKGLFDAMKLAPEPELSVDLERAIAATAELIACGRTPVRRERDENIEYVPEPEGATRLAQQFCQLAKGSARLDSRADVGASDLALVQRVAFDTLPPNRAAVLRATINGQPLDVTGLKRHALRRAVEDLQQVDVLDANRKLTPAMRQVCATAGLLPM